MQTKNVCLTKVYIRIEKLYMREKMFTEEKEK